MSPRRPSGRSESRDVWQGRLRSGENAIELGDPTGCQGPRQGAHCEANAAQCPKQCHRACILTNDPIAGSRTLPKRQATETNNRKRSAVPILLESRVVNKIH
jgi:hypothetical protein